MLQTSTFQFLKGLKNNNNKPWFEKNRKQYETARTEFIAFTQELISSIAKFDAPVGGLMAKDCIFRINRDVRFSKDKSPYKSNMACYFNKDGKKGLGAGYYMHIEPGKSFLAGGIWMPEAPALAAIRQEIDYSFNEWKKILSNNSFKKQFPAGLDTTNILSRPPKGYDENNPAIEYLKLKSFVAAKQFSDKEVQSKTFVKDASKAFEALKPIVDFINTAVG